MVRQNLIDFTAFSDELQKIAGWTLPTAAVSGISGGLFGGGIGALTAAPGDRLRGAGYGALAGGALGAGAGALQGRRFGKALEDVMGRPVGVREFVRHMRTIEDPMLTLGATHLLAGKPGVAERALSIASPIGAGVAGATTRLRKDRRQPNEEH